MAFESGSVTFRAFHIVGSTPKLPSEEMLEKLSLHLLKPTEIGVPEDVEWGWSGPNHIFDTQIDFENCVFNDCIHVAMRVDTNKVPGEIKQAHLQMEEAAVAKDNPSGFISKAQRRGVKDSVGRKMDDELRTGKYRKSKLVHILWDVQNHVIYTAASGSNAEKLCELFNRTFEADLQPMTAGHIALQYLEGLGKRRFYEDLVPTRFARSPEDPDAPAEYPWTAKGDGAKDWLGNEFLLWLWWNCATGDAMIKAGGIDVTILFDRSLHLDCVFNHTGKEAITAVGPTKLPEALVALRNGKVPRKAGLLIDIPGGQFSLGFNPETFAYLSAKFPEIEEADTPRTLFEERITLLRDLPKAFQGLFEKFLDIRISGGWQDAISEITQWYSKGAK